LFLRKIIKIFATRCHISKLKCIKFDFCWGSYSAPPDPSAAYKGAYFYGKGGGRTGEKGKGGEKGVKGTYF